jgi:DNA (cytosine-5)-methyltransferase 1
VRYLSLCSGIEAASVAWASLGWEPVAFAEIEAFPSAVLKHHYPHVPNLGDITKFREWPKNLGTVDLVCGGTPCQSFSVAGLRAGLADPRGNLMLTFLAIAGRYRPRWVVWENVPGVLSSGGGRDFGTFLSGLGQLGYGWAYRVLDAQYVRVDGFPRAVPQRRRRVFVVGCSGDWARAAAVLSERQSLLGDTAPRRKAGQGAAPTIASRTTAGGGLGTDFDCDGGLIPSISNALAARDAKQPRAEDNVGLVVTHSLKAEGFDASEDGTGRGVDSAGRGGYAGRRREDDANLVAFDMRGRDGGSQFEGPHETANIRAASGGSSKSYVAQSYAVRRLLPVECERLQGFPDGYTDVPYRGKPAADGPRYRALGNSWAVNVVCWIGRRIEMVEDICSSAKNVT